MGVTHRAPWQDLPPRYGPYQTVHRRFQNWVRAGTLERVLLAVAQHLQEAGGLDLKECFVDGHLSRPKRGRLVGNTKRGKGTKIMGLADRHGLPLALRTESAAPVEVNLVTATLEARIVADVPHQLIGEKAYDSDRLDEQLLQEYGTELIAPNRRAAAVHKTVGA